MPNSDLYPLKLQPSLRAKVWGGRMLAAQLQKKLPDAKPYGESWEVHDSACVLNGALRGLRLGELMQRFGQDLVGAGNEPADGFPLLAKFIQAESWLSLQVHPDNAQALRLEGEPRGKTEAWVILRAAPGARLICGLQVGTRRTQLAEAIRSKQLEPLLARRAVRAGDVLSIPANTVHALGPGLLIYEIQQASDITYRLYDWGRLGMDGKPRSLQIEKGLRVANVAARPQVLHPPESDDAQLLVASPYFETWRHRLQGAPQALDSRRRFHALTCIAGAVQLAADGYETLTLATGETGLLPACIERFSISGRGTVLRSCQPPLAR